MKKCCKGIKKQLMILELNISWVSSSFIGCILLIVELNDKKKHQDLYLSCSL